MKLERTQLLALALALVGALPLAAAPSHLVVPLSDPSGAATVETSLVMGSIHVVAGKAGEVAIDAVVSEDRDHDEECESCPAIAGRVSDRSERSEKGRGQMHRIPNTSFDLSAEEDHNKVKINSNSWARSLDLTISVPPTSSLKLSTVNDGDIVIEGINGELDLHNTNGDIRVENVHGPVNASTVNGDVVVVFSGAMAAQPMAFSTLNGDVDLTLPAQARIAVRLRSDNGDIYSDFDVALAAKPAEVQQDRSKGHYRVSVAKELTGTIGGGGPELFLKTFNGDILLRKGPG